MKNIVTAIDLGSTKACVLIGTSDGGGGMRILGHGEVPSEKAVC